MYCVCESIDEYEITEIIQNLKISKSAGPDNIGPKLIIIIIIIIRAFVRRTMSASELNLRRGSR